MPQYTCTVTYTANAKKANAVLTAPLAGDGAYQLNEGDTVEFIFNGPGTVSDALLILKEMKQGEGKSPFSGAGGSTVPVTSDEVFTVAPGTGQWCFLMHFYGGEAGKQTLKIVPDPELQVGSIPKVA